MRGVRRRVEQHLPVGLADGEHDDAQVAAELHLLERLASRTRCPRPRAPARWPTSSPMLLRGEVQELDHVRPQQRLRQSMAGVPVGGEDGVGARPPQLLLGFVLAGARRHFQARVQTSWPRGSGRGCRRRWPAPRSGRWRGSTPTLGQRLVAGWSPPARPACPRGSPARPSPDRGPPPRSGTPARCNSPAAPRPTRPKPHTM